MNERYHRIMDQARECLGGKCSNCEATETLEFDHIDPSTKLFTISVGWGNGAESFWLEVAKCQLLCRPCHEEKTATEPLWANRGENNPNNKLRPLDIKYVRKLSELGHSHRAIAREFDVSHNAIGRILRGVTWSWVT